MRLRRGFTRREIETRIQVGPDIVLIYKRDINSVRYKYCSLWACIFNQYCTMSCVCDGSLSLSGCRQTRRVHY